MTRPKLDAPVDEKPHTLAEILGDIHDCLDELMEIARSNREK